MKIMKLKLLQLFFNPIVYNKIIKSNFKRLNNISKLIIIKS